MKVREYISSKYQSYGINLSEADLLDMAQDAKVELSDEVTQSNSTPIKVAIVSFIPTLLLRATSINESGFSMSWNIDGIKAYYSMMCKQLGIKDELDNKPKIKFL